MAPETRGARRGSAGTGDPVPSIRPVKKGTSPQKGIFRKEAEYWTVGYSGKPFRLKDTRGLGYIAHLLRNPAVEFHVLDLVGGIAGRHDKMKAASRRSVCRAVMRTSRRPASISPDSATRARCSTIKP